MVKKVVVAGVNARNVARSARMAGFEVYSLAKYCDEDLKLFSKTLCFSEVTEEVLNSLIQTCQALDAPAVLSTGFEYFFKGLRRKVDILGSFDTSCLDKLKFARKLERAGIVVPETRRWRDSEKPEGEWLIKPRFGGGGVGIRVEASRIAKSRTAKPSRERFGHPSGEIILQKFVEGITVSTIVLSNGEEAASVSVNALFSGWRLMNAEGFLYSGNLTPFDEWGLSGVSSEEVTRTAEEVAQLFDVVGCCGVDLVLGDEVYVLELNPRIPGSLDSFELSTGENLFSMHMKAVNGKLPESPKFRRYALRAVYYAPCNLRAFVPSTSPFFADVPGWGEEFETSSPVVSIVSTGRSRGETLEKTLRRKELLESKFLSWV